MNEQALLFGAQQSLVGVYCQGQNKPSPDNSASPKGWLVLMFNAGLTHHVGPQRLHVHLARELAHQGISSLRVDLSGIGDSPAFAGEDSGEELPVQEAQEIIQSMHQRGYRHIVAFGICSGAKLALRIACQQPKVTGAILVNQALADDDPELAKEVSSHFYVHDSIRNPKAWRNLLTGKVNYKRIFQALPRLLGIGRPNGRSRARSVTDLFDEELAPAMQQDKNLLVLFSSRHQQLISLSDRHDQPQLTIRTYADTDHLFTSLEDQAELIAQVCQWCRRLQ